MSYPKETKDFYFFTPANAHTANLYISGGRHTQELDGAIRQSGVTTLVINHWGGGDLSFLTDYAGQIRRLFIKPAADLAFVSDLTNLESLGIWGSFDQIDFRRLRKLREFSAESKSTQGNLSECKGLEQLTLVCSRARDLQWISKLRSLRSLELQEMPLRSLSGIESLGGLEKLHMGRVTVMNLDGLQELGSLSVLTLAAMRNLTSIAAACASASLRELQIQSCRKVTDLSCIAQMSSLTKLTLNSMGTLPTLTFLRDLTLLEEIFFWEDTKIEDGELGFLKELPRLRRAGFRNRRHYQVREEKLRAFLEARRDLKGVSH
jgi:Leucine-rich repeat (LRR) protein